MPSKKRIPVLIVDDHPLFLQGLRRVLEQEEDIDVVGAAKDGEEALELARCLTERRAAREVLSPMDFERVGQVRDRLNGYVGSLHDVREPLGRSCTKRWVCLQALVTAKPYHCKRSSPRH